MSETQLQDPKHCLALALEHVQANRYNEAVAFCHEGLTQEPQNSDLLNVLGFALNQRGDSEKALTVFKEALRHTKVRWAILNNMVYAYQALGRYPEALKIHHEILKASPPNADVYYNYSITLFHLDRFQEALTFANQAVAKNPNVAELWIAKGNAEQYLGQIDAAIHSYDKAYAINPENAIANFNRSICYLLRGDFDRGFLGYEDRWLQGDTLQFLKELAGVPKWQGEPIPGKILRLSREQGSGDLIQMVRFLPKVAEMAGSDATILVECTVEFQQMLKVYQATYPQLTFVEPTDATLSDLRIPFFSLCRLLKLSPETIPNQVPYLTVPEDRRQRMKKIFAEIHQPKCTKKVGVVWAGAAGHKRDRERSISAQRFSMIFDIPHIHFVFLQKGRPEEKLENLRYIHNLSEFGPYLRDFADTAAAIEELDLVITVDTSVAHLAGALGKPVWNLITYVPDWRWMLGREDTPWYPSMKLFRQPKLGDWNSVLKNIRNSLEEWSA